MGDPVQPEEDYSLPNQRRVQPAEMQAFELDQRRAQAQRAIEEGNRAAQVIAARPVTNLIPTPTAAPQPAQPMGAPVQAAPTADPGFAASMNAFQAAEAELGRRGTYTGPPTRSVLTTTQAGPVDEATRAAQEAADAEMRAGMKRQTGVNETGASQQAQTFEGADVASQQEAQRVQQAAQEQAQAMQMQTQRADALNQDVLAGRINPNNVLGDSLSSGRLAAALGMFIVGLSQGQEGVNAFLSNINQTIDRDIAAQEANMANQRAGAAAQQNLVGQYRAIFADENAAREAARATMLQSVAQKLQAQQARMGEASQRPGLQMALAQLDAAQANASAAAQQARQSRVTTQTQRSGGTVGGPRIPVANAYTSIGNAISQAGDRTADNMREGMTAQRRVQAENPDEQRLALVGFDPRFRVARAAQGRPLPSNQAETTKAVAGARAAREIMAIQERAAGLQQELASTNNPIRAAEIQRELVGETGGGGLRGRASLIYGQLQQAGAMGDLEFERFADNSGISAGDPVSIRLRGATGLPQPRLQMIENSRRLMEQSANDLEARAGLEYVPPAELPAPY